MCIRDSLTDDQKKEMSDKEIELWEEKSKEGLLHNDANITSFLGDMRMVDVYKRQIHRNTGGHGTEAD